MFPPAHAALFLGTLCFALLAEPLTSSRASAPATQEENEDDSGFSYPPGRSGIIARTFIELFEEAGAQSIRTFEETYRAASEVVNDPLEERVARFEEFRRSIGSLQPRRMLAVEQERLSLVASSAKLGMEFEVSFVFEAVEPHNLVAVSLERFAPNELQDLYTDWDSVQELLDIVCRDGGVPAIALALVEEGKVTHSVVSGKRRSDRDDPVQLGDRFHIGSVTKSITATMIGRLIELGLLRWDMTLSEALPELMMDEYYQSCTLEQLLRHRAGFAPYTNFDEEEMSRLTGFVGSPTEQRAAWVAEILLAEPANEDGSHVYSNASYTVAGTLAESVTGKPWETLVSEYVFDPLGMRTAGFGWPASDEDPDHPWGHYEDGGVPRPQEDGVYELGAFLAPAGDVHCSVGDLTRYAMAHLQGLRGRDGILRAETMRRLHAPAPSLSGLAPPYACGWVVQAGDSASHRHWHNGSAGTFYALVEIVPEDDTAMVVLMNLPDFGEEVIGAIGRSLEARGMR